MSITIKMGDNPKPTCTISLSSSSFDNGTATATFSYTLSAMSGITIGVTELLWSTGAVRRSAVALI